MAAQSLATAATAGSDHKNRNLIIFAAAIFVRLLSPLLLWQLKIFTLFAPVFKCCALQLLLLLLLVPFLFSSSPSLSVTIRYASVLSPQHKFCMVIYFFVGLWPGDASAKPSEGGVWGLCDI